MPGVERLATVVDSILHDHHLRRPAAAPWFEVGLMLASALAMGFAVSRLSLAAAFLCLVVLIAAVAISGHVALDRYGVWLATGMPIVRVLVSCLSLYRYGLLDKGVGNSPRFSALPAPTWSIASSAVKSCRSWRRAAIPFCSATCEALPRCRAPDPALLTRVANRFSRWRRKRFTEGGTIDKPSATRSWRSGTRRPTNRPCCSRASRRCGYWRRSRIQKIGGARWRSPRLEVGIGINNGSVHGGQFGSPPLRLLVGDPVNVAARLEGETKTYGIAIPLGRDRGAGPNLATLPIDCIRCGSRAGIEIYARSGEKVADTPSLRERAHTATARRIWRTTAGTCSACSTRLTARPWASRRTMHSRRARIG
jgi:adenylate cyclase